MMTLETLLRNHQQKENLQNIRSILYSLRTVLFLGFIGLCFSCGDNPSVPISLIETPAGASSSESNLAIGDDGQIYLSWIETDSTNLSRLLFSKMDEEAWSSPRFIAEGRDWFVNWADFPSLTAFGDSGLVAHYLQKSAPDTYAYDVKLITSIDGGENWQQAFSSHNDSTYTEHGFVSKIEMNDEQFMAVWLDGRQYAYAEKDTTLPKQMSLRSGVFDSNNTKISEALVDLRTCDCCQTDLVMTSKGPMVIYRDRSENEIRDIYYSHYINNAWTEPKALYNDGWEIFGCPVNGPAISANENLVSVAWFTLANNRPKINVLFSQNSGESFAELLSPDFVNPMGRVDIEIIDETSALVTWVDSTSEGITVIFLQKLFLDGQKSEVLRLTETSEERSSGFPRMVVRNTDAYITWTEVGDRLSIKTAKVDLTLMN